MSASAMQDGHNNNTHNVTTHTFLGCCKVITSEAAHNAVATAVKCLVHLVSFYSHYCTDYFRLLFYACFVPSITGNM